MFAKKTIFISCLALNGLLMYTGKSHALNCSVSSDSWNSGYVSTVTVTNNDSTSINTWRVSLEFNQTPNITNSWNAVISESGNTVNASNSSYNGNLNAGQSATFGFQGTHNGNFQNPTCTTGDTPSITPTPTSSPTITPTPTLVPTSVTTPTPTPTPTPIPSSVGSNTLEVELEALSGQEKFSPFVVQNDSSASGGQYVVWPNNGNQNNTSPSDSTSGQLTVAFDLSQSTSVNVSVISNMANSSDDSFHYRMDQGSWNTQNNALTNGWEAVDIGSYNLTSGAHTLVLQRREDGTKLDKVVLIASAGQIGSAIPTVIPTPSPTPSGENLVIQENEVGFCLADGSIENNSSGYTGSGYVNTIDATGARIVWRVNAPYTSTYALKWRYANQSSTNRSATVTVNGNAENVSFPTTGAWNSWTTATSSIQLNAGENEIILQAGISEGLSNIDSLTIEGSGLTAVNCASQPTPTPSPTATPSPTPTPAITSKQKWRIINTTDMGADPDDEQSLVRQLVMANEYDLEGLITTTGCWKKSQSNTAIVDRILNAYRQAYPNLSKHADDFPTPDYLDSINVLGQTGYGMSGVGSSKDSAGSNLIINAVDKNDPRPLWVTCWGGCNTIAQALWRVKNDRSSSELSAFISKLRVFDILGQGDAGNWIAQTFPNLLYIRATGVYGWQPSKGSSYIEEIQTHGPLGAVYPDTRYATEGDTPAFMHLAHPALNDPEKVDQGGWGGRFNTYKTQNISGMSCMDSGAYNPHQMHGNTSEGVSAISKWNNGYTNDFLARMDWAVNSNYNSANHHPVIVINNDANESVMYLNSSAGSQVNLNANGSSDPDSDSLTYSWSYYNEPSSYNGSVSISNSSASNATVNIPSNASGKSIHIILTLRDNGSPNLYTYRRVVINVQ